VLIRVSYINRVVNEPIKHGAARASKTPEGIKMDMICLRRFIHSIPELKPREKIRMSERKAKMVCSYQVFYRGSSKICIMKIKVSKIFNCHALLYRFLSYL